MKAPAKRGRSYSTANTTYLLDLIEEIEPCGAEEWNSVASRYNAHFGGESRSCDDLKNRFKTLKGVKQPTGDPSCPPEVIRAKRLQISLERRMDVQTLEDDDDNLDDRTTTTTMKKSGTKKKSTTTMDMVTQLMISTKTSRAVMKEIAEFPVL